MPLCSSYITFEKNFYFSREIEISIIPAEKENTRSRVRKDFVPTFYKFSFVFSLWSWKIAVHFNRLYIYIHTYLYIYIYCAKMNYETKKFRR